MKEDLKISNFNIRLNKIRNTSCFYLENKEIESCFDKFDFKKDTFYFYKQ